MKEHRPDSWVIVKITHEEKPLYKVLGGWASSYLNGSSWRLNSGVEKCEYDVGNDEWRFYGSSGSAYVVHPSTYGLRMATAAIWNVMKKRYPDNVELLENQDWSQMEWK